MDRFSKFCLLMITLLLAIVALRPFVRPTPARAAGHYKYLVVPVNVGVSDFQSELDRRVEDGWELAAPVYTGGIPMLIFRREAQ